MQLSPVLLDLELLPIEGTSLVDIGGKTSKNCTALQNCMFCKM